MSDQTPVVIERRKSDERDVKAGNRLANAVIVLAVMVFVLCIVGWRFSNSTDKNTRAINQFEKSIEAIDAEASRIVDGQLEAKVRGCTLLAIQTPEIFPASCLEKNTMDLFARDLIDALPEEGEHGEVRRKICDALDQQGVTDEDCL